jgi:hypothetical protein
MYPVSKIETAEISRKKLDFRKVFNILSHPVT